MITLVFGRKLFFGSSRVSSLYCCFGILEREDLTGVDFGFVGVTRVRRKSEGLGIKE